MKQNILVLILILTCAALNAQKISVGMELGTISSLSVQFQESQLENIRHTYYTGLNVNYHFNKKIEFATGLHYLRQGHKSIFNSFFSPNVRHELIQMFDYLIVPTALNVNIGKANRFSITAGIYNGLNIKAAQDYPEAFIFEYYDSDLSDTNKKYLLGGIIGASYNTYLNDRIQLKSNVKYYHGLNNTIKNPNSDLNIWKDIKYRSVVISVGVNYAFSKN